MRSIILIAHDIRSCHNVGSLLRTADGFGVECVYLTGYTPHPLLPKDERLPHLAQKIERQIHKTALGAEHSAVWKHSTSLTTVLRDLSSRGYQLAALEQSKTAIPLPDYDPPQKVAVLLGREVEGIDPAYLALTDVTLEIPMFGQKESFNVTQAAAIALYQLRSGSEH